jgi:hypothetical protein
LEEDSGIFIHGNVFRNLYPNKNWKKIPGFGTPCNPVNLGLPTRRKLWSAHGALYQKVAKERTMFGDLGLFNIDK